MILPKLSVIVPIYKVEKYLRRCLESIINQTYKNLEIILVDDGSPDNCGNICDEYAVKDNRIKVIHKVNGGLSDARNAGLNIATGEYVSFIDSDDWINADMYEELIGVLQESGADISIGGVVNEFEGDANSSKSYFTVNGIKKDILNNEIEVLTNIDEIRNFLINGWSAWDKVYKRSIFSDICFPVGIINEDEAVAISILHKCKKICVVHTPFYHYILRSNSITTSSFSIKKLDWYNNTINNCKLIQKYYPDLLPYAEARRANAAIWSIKQMIKSDDYDGIYKNKTKEIFSDLRKNKFKYLLNKKILIRCRLYILIAIFVGDKGLRYIEFKRSSN